MFATGLSGIVAEYILATMASYFLGDSTVQWAMIISLMLFFMGFGARITKYINKNLFAYFLGIEFILSIIVSFSALITYSASSFTPYAGVIIYLLAAITGTLIGMELPVAVRLNEEFDELKVNVSNILEKDYYGSLLGGVFFSFVGLPYLGLTYTPFMLGFINLAVAIALLNYFPQTREILNRTKYNIIAAVLFIGIVFGIVFSQDIIFYGEQHRYKDKIVYSDQSKYQKIVITEWKDNYWLYLNNNLQFSSYDEPLYHEVLVHPAMSLSASHQQILILGGGDGCAARELLKYQAVETIDLVDLDPKITQLAKEHPILTEINENSLASPKVNVVNTDGFIFLEKTRNFYDVIIIDLPDPRTVELSRLYSLEFYTLCKRQLRPGGVLITQAGSPYFAPRSYWCINKTIQEAGFTTLPLHNQIITMGEWGWILGHTRAHSSSDLKERLLEKKFEEIETQWISHEALPMITSFGKNYFMDESDSIEVNTIHHPVLHRYYLKGGWDVY